MVYHDCQAVLLIMMKSLIHGVAWSASLRMAAACISDICSLKATGQWIGTGLQGFFGGIQGLPQYSKVHPENNPVQ